MTPIDILKAFNRLCGANYYRKVSVLIKSMYKVAKMALPNKNMTVCMEDQKGQIFHFVISGLLTTLFVMFGLCGTLYCCTLLVKQTTRFSKLLLTLCLWDFVVLISAFGFYGLVTLIKGHMTWKGYFVYTYLIFYPICNWSMTGSKLILLQIALERYMAISSPFNQRIREGTPVIRIQLLIIVISLIPNLPSFFELKLIDCHDSFIIKLQIWPTKMRSDKLYTLFYRVIFRAIFESFLPFLAVLVLTLKTVCVSRSLQSSKTPLKVDFRKRCHSFSEASATISVSGSMSHTSLLNPVNSVQRKISPAAYVQIRFVTLLTSVVIKFLICYSLPTLINFLEFIDSEISASVSYGYLIDISNFFVVLNSSTNWLLYCKWRKENKRNTYRRRATKDLLTANMKWAHFEPSQIGSLIALWRPIDKTEFGINLIEPICKEREHLSRFAQVKEDQDGGLSGLESPIDQINEFESNQQSCISSQTLANFIDQLINSLARNKREDVCNRIRETGYAHYQANVLLKNPDWLTIKKRLVLILIENNSERKSVEAANKFASFLIGEMKFGYSCKAFIGNP